MNLLRNIIKVVIPLPVRQFLRRTYRGFIFRKAMNRFLKNPDSFNVPEDPVIIDLIYGWGNEDWSGLGEFLVGCIHHAQLSRGPTLECGSGLSTILIGAIAQKKGYTHHALEHNPDWAKKVQSYLNRYHIDSVKIIVSPLKDYGDFSWYDFPMNTMPDHFTLVICDGPPGDTKGGRYGLVPVMKDKLKPGCIILLDDAGREQEKVIAKNWKDELGTSYKLHGNKNPYIELEVIE